MSRRGQSSCTPLPTQQEARIQELEEMEARMKAQQEEMEARMKAQEEEHARVEAQQLESSNSCSRTLHA